MTCLIPASLLTYFRVGTVNRRVLLPVNQMNFHINISDQIYFSKSRVQLKMKNRDPFYFLVS